MLRTSSELIDYAVEARDGAVGTIKDLLFDDTTWRVNAIVVDTGGFLRHHNVLIEPARIAALHFPAETMVLSITKSEVEAGPGLDLHPPVSMQQTRHEQPPGQVHDRHLRSSVEIGSYAVWAKDEHLGFAHGLIIDTTDWIVRYLIVDTGEWLMGRLVLVGPQAVDGIDWSSQSIRVTVSADDVRHSPPYDETDEISRDYEAFLHDHYSWPPYWP